jgi:hypothetical protein
MQSLRWDGGVQHIWPYAGQRIDPSGEFYPHPSVADERFYVFPGRSADGSFNYHWPRWFALFGRAAMAVFGIAGIYVLPPCSPGD